MSIPENGFTVSFVQTIINWGVTLLLGTLFPVLLLAFPGSDDTSGVVRLVAQCLVAFLSLMLYGTALMLLPLGLLLLAARSLNRSPLSFERYMIVHNLLHLAIGLVSFTALDFLLSGSAGAYQIPFLGMVYTIAGLLVWNASFLVRFARRKNTW